MTSFDEMWAPTWEVEKTIKGARACIVENSDRTYKSGRAVVEAVFFDGNRREICRREGMRLTSKKGVEYVVCRREPTRSVGEPTRSVGATDETSVGELLHSV